MFHSSCLYLVAILIAALAQQTLAYSETWDIRSLLTDTHVQYQDHEIHSVEEGLEEDVFYITKRAPLISSPECSDCEYFTPWDENESTSVVGGNYLYKMYQPVNLTQQQFKRRANNFKEGSIVCPHGGTITLQSPKYPTNEEDRKSVV